MAYVVGIDLYKILNGNAYGKEGASKKNEKKKRFLFYCSKCGFEYSSGSEKPCSCSFCGTVNECCY